MDRPRSIPQGPGDYLRRLAAVLFGCLREIQAIQFANDRLRFSVNRIPRDGSSHLPSLVVLEVIFHRVGPNEPALTIRKPIQDSGEA